MLAVKRRVLFLPGREREGATLLHSTESVRRDVGQYSQVLLRGTTDPHEYQWVQFWVSWEAYDLWRHSIPRNELMSRLGHYMTFEPTQHFDMLE